ncbi:MAG: hypothetical protein WDO15_24770 [Bacteroidota bacterium]
MFFDLRNGNKIYSNTEVFKEKSKAASKLNKLAALTGGAAPGGKGGFIKLLCPSYQRRQEQHDHRDEQWYLPNKDHYG